MQVLWEFHQERGIWLEWIEDGITKIRKFTEKQYDEFMYGRKIDSTIVAKEETLEEDELDFLN